MTGMTAGTIADTVIATSHGKSRQHDVERQVQQAATRALESSRSFSTAAILTIFAKSQLAEPRLF